MSTWDIAPGGVRDVLARTQAAATPFEGQMTSLNAAMEGSAVEAGSQIVSTALQGFADSIRREIEFVFTRTGACLNAAVQATNAYVQGDLEMAANAQHGATSAALPPPPNGSGRNRAE